MNQSEISLNNQGGTLAPAFAAFASADATGVPVAPVGTMTFVLDSSYVQGPAGVLDIDLAGDASHDVVSIGSGGVGAATLAGTVSVETVAGYDPALGTTFDVLLADTITGTPVPTGLTPSGHGYAASIAAAPDGRQALRLTVVPVPEPAAAGLFAVATATSMLRRRRRMTNQ